MGSGITEAAGLTTHTASHRPGDLALALQEAFTVAVRLKSGRQVAADAGSFRVHIKNLLGSADQEARRAGYDGEHVQLAVEAFVALLDELVLNSNQPMFAQWSGRPLHEEIFGDHLAGETFFRHVNELLGRQDSPDLADVLEVYQLCLLLGFRGKFGAGARDGLPASLAPIQEKVRRIRGGPTEFSPAWRLPDDEVIVVRGDPWVRRLAIIAGAAMVLAALLFLAYRFALASGVTEIETITAISV